MSYMCHGCRHRYPKDSSLHGHLNQRPQCRTAHGDFLQRQQQAYAANQPLVDPDDPEQWVPSDLDDPEPTKDALMQDPNTFDGGRLPELDRPGLFLIDESNKRTRSGTINRFSLIKAEIRPFPDAAKVIRRNQPTPWEVHVSPQFNHNIIIECIGELRVCNSDCNLVHNFERFCCCGPLADYALILWLIMATSILACCCGPLADYTLTSPDSAVDYGYIDSSLLVCGLNQNHNSEGEVPPEMLHPSQFMFHMILLTKFSC